MTPTPGTLNPETHSKVGVAKSSPRAQVASDCPDYPEFTLALRRLVAVLHAIANCSRASSRAEAAAAVPPAPPHVPETSPRGRPARAAAPTPGSAAAPWAATPGPARRRPTS